MVEVLLPGVVVVVLPGVVVVVVPVVLSGVVVVPMEPPAAGGVPVVLLAPMPVLGDGVLVLPGVAVVEPVVLPPIVPWSVPGVPAEPVVPLWGEATVPWPPAEVPLEPVLWPSAATATTRTPPATNVANFSLIVIPCLPWLWNRKLRTARRGVNPTLAADGALFPAAAREAFEPRRRRRPTGASHWNRAVRGANFAA